MAPTSKVVLKVYIYRNKSKKEDTVDRAMPHIHTTNPIFTSKYAQIATTILLYTYAASIFR